jgi:hypothetical protein
VTVIPPRWKTRNSRIKASAATVAQALVGDYKREHLFTLAQSAIAHRFYERLTAECDIEIEHCLKAFVAEPCSRCPSSSITKGAA